MAGAQVLNRICPAGQDDDGDVKSKEE
jgi:hypothetical protein